MRKSDAENATLDAIRELNAENPQGRRYGDVWEMMSKTSVDSFKEDALRWLKDRSEMTGSALDIVDWEEVFKTFHPTPEAAAAATAVVEEIVDLLNPVHVNVTEPSRDAALELVISALKNFAKVHGISVSDALVLVEDATTCQGHESLDGAHMGETVYCDGTCR